MNYKNIVLIGMRCTGKSGIGREIAGKMKWKFYDLDSEIVKLANKDIKTLTNNGLDWYEFRKLETEILNDLLNIDSIVISCGGGVGVNDIKCDSKQTWGVRQANILLNSASTCKILLQSDISKIINRFEKDLKSKINRPILYNHDYKLDLLITDYNRKGLYTRLASFKIDTTFVESKYCNIIDDILTKINIRYNSVIGYPIEHSISPLIHNTGYENLGIANKYKFIKVAVNPVNLYNVREIMTIGNIYGMSVTSPHKESIIRYLDYVDPVAISIGAVNTVIRADNNKLIGYNTDYIGVLNALNGKHNGKVVAILGNGGAAKAAFYGVKDSAKSVIIFARDKKKAKKVFKLYTVIVEDITNIKDYDFDILINATSCGSKIDECPIDVSVIKQKHIVFDMIYSPLYTKLLSSAQKIGAQIILGTEMLIHQALKQFELYTGKVPNFSVISNAVNEYINKKIIYENICSKIYISLGCKNLNELQENIELTKKLTKNIEIRADYLENITLDDISVISNSLSDCNIIFTLRKEINQGNFVGDNYNHLIKQASELFAYVDIDLNDAHLLDELRITNAILSYHNFQHSDDDIYKIFDKMLNYDAKVYKIATMCNSNNDALKLLYFLENNNERNIIIIGMGEYGKIVRLYAPKFGGLATFTSLDAKSTTAPGQITFDEMVKFYNI